MHTTRFATVAAAAMLLAGCSTSRTTTVESAGGVSPSVSAPADNASLPAGTTLQAQLDQTLGTQNSKEGDAFTATVSNTVYAQNGSVVIPAGAKIEGRVTALDDSDNASEPALIKLDFDRISFGGRSYPFEASIERSSPVESGGTSSSDRTRNLVIGGTLGAALGAVLGDGDLKNIVIGGAVGAAAGSLVSLGTEMNASLPAGSMMTLRTTNSVMLR